MGKDQTRAISRVEGLRRSMRGRRSWFGLIPARHADSNGESITNAPRLGWGILIGLAMTLVAATLAVWARERPLVVLGRTMDDTRLVRVPLEIEDPGATEAARDSARQRTPRVYVAESAVLEEIQTSLANLPRTLASVTSLDQVEASIRDQFKLTPEQLEAVKAESQEGQPTPAWESRVRALAAQLRTRPLVDKQTWQQSTQEGLHTDVRLVNGSASVYVRRTELVNAEDAAKLSEAAGIMARDAGFAGPLRQLVTSRLTIGVRPTYRYDAAATIADQQQAAQRVNPVIQKTSVGQIIFRRGDTLTPAQFDLYKAELAAFITSDEAWRVWLRRASIIAAVSAITLAIAGYTALFCPLIRRDPRRMAGLAVVLLAALATSCVGTVASPSIAPITIFAPTLLVAIIVAIAYDQRVALAITVLHGVLVCIALDQGLGIYATIVAGVGCAVAQLRELRDRNSLFRLSMTTGVAIAVATVLAGLIDRPISSLTIRETAIDAGIGAVGAMIVGGFTLFTLPTIERVFDIATGMTLVELRDPKHPLLRELQLRAPGTYNHSLNVAAISEAAAESVGANSLLTYVGALYHDVGKMNKPDYFVENQSGGPNRHEKLSPAMSLLVIVGHVKDGVELAREFDLPPAVQHFIESHHGTTLVEYFYHRAKKLAVEQAVAEARADEEPPSVHERPTIISEPERRPAPDAAPDEDIGPQEFEYRYPGPKPRTIEAAIVMLADAIESAARTLTEPTPARIEQLVHGLANKRLLDEQFDDCEMTLRDLHTISDSIAKSVASIYHGRITYKSTIDMTAQKRA